MDIEKLIERLYKHNKDWGEGRTIDFFEVFLDCKAAFTALSTLQAENEEMQKQLNEFSEFLCHMTGNLLSKTNYTAQAMISAAENYQQRVCDNDCDLRADLARVTAERDALIKRTAGDCWSCIRRYECNSRKGSHSRCWEFDPWLLKED